MKLAFLTYAKAPSLSDDDLLAVAALRARGVDVAPRVWDAPGASDGVVDGAVVRSCWDYHERVGEFLGVVDALVANGVPVVNPAPMIRWNVDKGYLRDLEARGARLPKTVWVPRGERAPLADILRDGGLDRVVVKPRISASSHDTFIVSKATAHDDEPRFGALVGRKDLIVQEHIPEIAEGEVSLLFFGGEFSHAVRKKPAPGDFRVQSEYGGTSHRIDARPEWIDVAKGVLDKVDPLVYARIDVIVSPRGLFWMELEATDAELFFRLDPEAPDRFADALVRALR